MKDKKIGIITILNVNNYGAELQAFALHHKLKLLGYNNEIINYLYYKNPRHLPEKRSKSVIKNSKVTEIKDFILNGIDQLSKWLNPKIAKTRAERFYNFHANHTGLSREYRSISDLYNDKHLYDVVIVGSDQVWNPNNPTNIEPYFLTFAPQKAKKLSYASSFGVSKIDPQYHELYGKMLNNLDYISSREETGVKIVNETANREAAHVVDPTLLLAKNEWEKLAVPFDFSEPYILIFVFKNSKYITDLALALQKEKGYKILRICKNEMRVESDSKIINLRDLGPQEFLGVYQKAAIVLTSSFHGTVFSLIYEKPFYVITPSSKNNNSRQLGLLKLVNLESRLIKEDEEFPDFNKLAIDYNPVRKIIENEKQKSVSYLVNAIDN